MYMEPAFRDAILSMREGVSGRGGDPSDSMAHQLQVMAACAQALTESAKGIGHAIDFRREGFGDQGDMQGCRHGPSVG